MAVNLRTVYAFAREMYPKKNPNQILYGTAGFRGDAKYLDSVMYRMGVLACLRSRLLGKAVGVMITASHNPEPDNGVKIVDPMGEMLEASWEQIATDLANVQDNQLEEKVSEIIKTQDINVGASSLVFVGMDNRYHSPQLLKAVCDGVLSLKGKAVEYGIVTTPMLHYYVVCQNTDRAYGVPTEEGYYSKLIKAFEKLRGTKLEKGNYKNKIYFDGANGVGARKMLQFLKRMNNSLDCEVFNKGEGKINFECGADFVKTGQKPPSGMPIPEPNTRCVSVDGDADRVIYYFVDENGQFNMLDGDRIATLIADYLMDMVNKCGLDLKLGIVQTAYANGASTDYIRDKLKVPVACAKTGVKHLHHKALEFDIGVYFEANGHGTIVFSNNAKEKIKKSASSNETSADLLNVIDLINETVGDAISDMLLVETILHSKGWDVKDWLNTYIDLPNMLLKVKVQDRNIITTADAERKCVTPNGLQDKIDTIVGNYQRGRSFVRPSGTEDVVRVYAEAATREDTELLAYEVAGVVHQLAGGVGDPPVLPGKKMNSHI